MKTCANCSLSDKSQMNNWIYRHWHLASSTNSLWHVSTLEFDPVSRVCRPIDPESTDTLTPALAIRARELVLLQIDRSSLHCRWSQIHLWEMIHSTNSNYADASHAWKTTQKIQFKPTRKMSWTQYVLVKLRWKEYDIFSFWFSLSHTRFDFKCVFVQLTNMTTSSEDSQ